jgi:hypothetical protein
MFRQISKENKNIIAFSVSFSENYAVYEIMYGTA